MTRHCTVPNIFGLGKWFERNYSSCCRVHDNEYDARVNRFVADRNFLNCLLMAAQDRSVWRKLYHYPFIWIAYYVLVLAGWYHYYGYNKKLEKLISKIFN